MMMIGCVAMSRLLLLVDCESLKWDASYGLECIGQIMRYYKFANCV